MERKYWYILGLVAIGAGIYLYKRGQEVKDENQQEDSNKKKKKKPVVDKCSAKPPEKHAVQPHETKPNFMIHPAHAHHRIQMHRSQVPTRPSVLYNGMEPAYYHGIPMEHAAAPDEGIGYMDLSSSGNCGAKQCEYKIPSGL
jgi:hypothetical protein